MANQTITQVDPDLVSGLRLILMRLARRLRQQAEGEVTPSMLSALSSIERQGPLTLGDLAAVERISAPTMTTIISRLLEAGLIVKQVDANDRRFARVGLSPEGKRYVTKSRSRKDAYLAHRLAGLTPEQLKVLGQAVTILESILEEQP
ncbi:MAG: MarR family winged helix-turn-helix transcriptional regulator [Actinomycetota bacterium]|nr:MarR family transcriptional regulator [Actinomycetota bacterium]